MRVRKALVVIFASLLCAACSGGSSTLTPMRDVARSPGGTPASASLPEAAAELATATIVIIVPNVTSAAVRKPRYISPSTQSMSIAVDRAPYSTVNLTPASPDCTVPAPLDELTCTVTITVAPGSHTFGFLTLDGPNGTGNQLSTNGVVQTISIDQANQIGITLLGLVASISVVPEPGQSAIVGNETQGISFAFSNASTVNITARDADGNYILGPGAPVIKINLSSASGGITIAAANNGDPNGYVLDSTGFGSGTLDVFADDANAFGPLAVPIASTTISSFFSGQVGQPGNDVGSATQALYYDPQGIAYNPASGDLYVVDTASCMIHQVDATGYATNFAGMPYTCGYQNGTGTGALFNAPVGIAFDPATSDLYVADSNNCSIRQITLAGVVTTLVGGGATSALLGQQCGDLDGPAQLATLDLPTGIAYDASDGNLYFSDSGNLQIRQVTTAGAVTTIAGKAPAATATAGTCVAPVDGSSTTATFCDPTGLAIDSENGDIYVADTTNDLIRQVTTAGAVTTIAGNLATAPSAGFVDGSGTSAKFDKPSGLAYDSSNGDLYLTDNANCAIRQITTSGVVTTVAGLHNISLASPAICAYENGTASTARFNDPAYPIYVPGQNSLYITDYENQAIRKVQL